MYLCIHYNNKSDMTFYQLTEYNPHFGDHDTSERGPAATFRAFRNGSTLIKSEEPEDILGLRVETEATDLLRYWEVSKPWSEFTPPTTPAPSLLLSAMVALLYASTL